jgi:hypothetical protein
MTVLSRPCHPIVADALDLARDWCVGHIIDSAPVLGHAVKVALMLGRHISDPAPELVAAVLLHGSPEYAPKEIDLDVLLVTRFGLATARIVWRLEQERIALDQRPVPDVTTADRWTLCASAADKIVNLRSILRRASRAPDPAAYWRTQRAVVDRVPYFTAFHTTTAPYLPPGMGEELARLVVRVEQATGRLLDDRG